MKFISVFSLLFGFSAFAGDSYLICSSLDYDGDFLDQSYAIEEYIMDSDKIKASFYDVPDDLYEVEYNISKNQFTGKLLDIHLGTIITEVKTSLEYYEIVKISDKFGCMLTD